MRFLFRAIIFASLYHHFCNAQDCPATVKLTCESTDSPPVLDANLDEWASVTGISTDIFGITKTKYQDGSASFKCLRDEDKIYFALEIPGDYRFNTTDNHLCAAIGTMFKVGSKATFVDMGGCPDAAAGCPDGVPDSCTDYTVDIGAHWELRTTNRSQEYPIIMGGGNDLVANKDDEYSVSAYCRFDDDGENAGNEWSGAWDHTNPAMGEEGSYIFEMARSLSTKSAATDVQLKAGETYQFGIAFWDPYEREVEGWTDAGHFLTGCGDQWIDLELASGAMQGRAGWFGMVVTALVALLWFQ